MAAELVDLKVVYLVSIKVVYLVVLRDEQLVVEMALCGVPLKAL